MSHTKGKITTKRTATLFELSDAQGPILRQRDGIIPTSHDAARLVECWNALESVSDPSAVPYMLDETRKTLAWLKHIYPEVRSRMPISVILGFDSAIKSAETVIARAEGRES